MESQGFYGKTHCCDEFISVSTSLHEDYLKYIYLIYGSRVTLAESVYVLH